MTGTGRSDHREKKKTENSIVNLEEPIKSISPLSHSSILLAWSIYGLLKPETDNNNNNNNKNWFPISVKQERDWIRQEDNDLTSYHGIRFDIETRKKKWRRRMIAWKKIRSGLSVARRASIGSMANADIEGDMFWNTPLSSVLMSRFLWAYLGDRFFPRACQEGIYVSCYHGVLFAAQTVPTGRNFDRWKPETSMNSCFFLFLSIFDPDTRHFRSISPSTFNTVTF